MKCNKWIAPLLIIFLLQLGMSFGKSKSKSKSKCKDGKDIINAANSIVWMWRQFKKTTIIIDTACQLYSHLSLNRNGDLLEGNCIKVLLLIYMFLTFFSHHQLWMSVRSGKWRSDAKWH